MPVAGQEVGRPPGQRSGSVLRPQSRASPRDAPSDGSERCFVVALTGPQGSFIVVEPLHPSGGHGRLWSRKHSFCDRKAGSRVPKFLQRKKKESLPCLVFGVKCQDQRV